jgi:large repetitive protein
MLAPSHAFRSSYRITAIVLATAGLLVGLLAAGTQPAAASTTGYTVSRVPINLAYQVAVDPATGLVYTGRVDEIQVIDSSTSTVSTTISMPSDSDEVEGIAADPATDTIYATLRNASTLTYSVAVINGASNTITTTINEPSGTSAYGIAVDSTTDTIYTAGSAVTVIDGSTNTVTATISAAGILVAVDQPSDTIYAGGGNSLSVIDASTDAVTGSVSLGTARAIGIAVDPQTNTVYVADNKNSEVVVINGATDSVTTTISVGTPGNLDDVAVDPQTDTVFGSGGGFGTLFTGVTWVIDGSTDAVTSTLPRGGYSIAVDPSTGAAYAPGDDFSYGAALWEITPSATNGLSPVIALGPDVAFAVGTSGSMSVVQSALPSATFTESGALPAGVTFSAGFGELAGTPAAGTEGSYPITITAANGIAPDDTINVTLVVFGITSASHTTFTVGKPGTFQVVATGPPSFTLYDYGVLPGGVTFSSAGTLAGTPGPATGGTYPVQFTAVASYGQVTQDFTLTVDEAPAITSASRATFTAGKRNVFTITTSGFPAATLREHGRLPAGVRFVSEGHGKAKLVGFPARSARGHSYVITITAGNGVGASANQTFTLRIRRRRG